MPPTGGAGGGSAVGSRGETTEERRPAGSEGAASGTGLRVLLVAMAAIGPFSLNIFKPCLPWIKADFGVEISTAQLGLSLAIVAAAAATVLAGPLADLFGRRPLTIVSVHAYFLGGVVGALAPAVEVLIAARVLQAASSSVALALARTIIHDHVADAQRSIARVTLVALGSVLLAPVLGGLLIDAIGWRAVFAFTALVGAALLGPVHRSLPETAGAGRGAGPRALLRLGPMLASPTFLGYALQSSLHFAIFFAYTSAAAYLMVDVLGRPAFEYGVWFVVVALCVAAGLGAAERLAGKVRSGVLACLGSACVMLGCLALAGTLRAPALTPLALFAPATLAGFGIGLALPATNAGVMDVEPALAGTASGLLACLQFALAAVFAQLVVQDEPRTPALLAALALGGGVAAFLCGFLSLGHAARRRP